MKICIFASVGLQMDFLYNRDFISQDLTRALVIQGFFGVIFRATMYSFNRKMYIIYLGVDANKVIICLFRIIIITGTNDILPVSRS